MVDRKTIRKEIENFKQKTVEQYFVHTCGYDFVIDQINADVTFTGTKKECEFFIENNKLKKWFEEIHKDVQASNHDYLILLEQKAQLENQIEKMKCCSNCVHFDFIEPNYCQKGVYRANKNVCGEWCFGN